MHTRPLELYAGNDVIPGVTDHACYVPVDSLQHRAADLVRNGMFYDRLTTLCMRLVVLCR